MLLCASAKFMTLITNTKANKGRDILRRPIFCDLLNLVNGSGKGVSDLLDLFWVSLLLLDVFFLFWFGLVGVQLFCLLYKFIAAIACVANLKSAFHTIMTSHERPRFYQYAWYHLHGLLSKYTLFFLGEEKCNKFAHVNVSTWFMFYFVFPIRIFFWS